MYHFRHFVRSMDSKGISQIERFLDTIENQAGTGELFPGQDEEQFNMNTKRSAKNLKTYGKANLE